MRCDFTTLAAAMLGVALCGSAAHAVGPYVVTDLGGFEPKAINDHGVLAGRGADGRPARWENGVASGLGIASFGAANSINNAGRIVGTVNGASPSFEQAFVYNNTGTTTFLTHFHSTLALDVNASGTFGGWAYQPAGGIPKQYGPRAFINQVNNWISLPGNNYAERVDAMNDNGVAVGHGGLATYRYNGPGTGTYLSNFDYVADINNAGDIIGGEGVTEQTALLRRANGTFVSLPKPSGMTGMGVGAVNESLHIVGNMFGAASRAFIWTQTTGTVDLNTVAVGMPAGWVITRASDINEAGQIIGNETLPFDDAVVAREALAAASQQ